MSFQSINALQQTLANSVFRYVADRKKAAGRALGTLVEIVTFCTLRAWNLSAHVVIERRVPEFANREIFHNVEFSLHHIHSRHEVSLKPPPLPLTAAKLKRELPFLQDRDMRPVRLLSKDSLKRNAALLVKPGGESPVVANINSLDESQCSVVVCELSADHSRSSSAKESAYKRA